MDNYKRTGIKLELYITSPLFDYWLLMHHEDYYDIIDVKELNSHMEKRNEDQNEWIYAKNMVEFLLNISENRKDSRFRFDPTTKRCVDYNQNGVFDKMKNIIDLKKTTDEQKHFRFDNYYRPALLNKKIFSINCCKELDRFNDECGTNVGSLVYKLLYDPN